MLKLNNQIVLNAWDLQRYFSPWDAIRQIEDVLTFARVHCQRLAIILRDQRNADTGGPVGYSAVYLNKQFWIEVVEEGSKPSSWKYSPASVKACFQDILKTKFEEYTSPEQNKPLLREITDARVDEKLQYIIASGKLTGTPQDVRTTILLLALCELAEVDVFAQSFQRWETEPKKPQTAAASVHQPSRKEPVSLPKEPPAEQVPDVEVLRLETRGTPYRFLYYEQDKLEAGQTIRSIRLEAVMGRDKANNVAIHLVHPKTNQVVLSTVLNAGTFRDCTVVDGKIVKLLPTMAISRNLCVARTQKSAQFEVVPLGSDLWTIDMDTEKARGVTCLAAGDEQTQGFLFVSGGKVLTSFYKPCEDFYVRMEMQIITDPVVEAKIVPEGYCLLTSGGSVISDIPEWNGRKNLVSLSEFGRKPDYVIENMPLAAEVVLNESLNSLAVRDRHGKMDVIFADDPARSIHKTGDRTFRI